LDIVEFLRARLDEDEAPWGDFIDLHANHCGSCGGPPGPFPCDCRWPERMRREVEAKRRIVDYYEFDRSQFPESGDAAPTPAVLRDVLCLLALSYADHPDYRQEWKP
jgi:hypothetical protein